MNLNLDQIELILVILVFLLFIIAGHSSGTQSDAKEETSRGGKKSVDQNTKFQNTLNDVAKIDDIANLLSFMLRLQEQQQSLKAEIDRISEYNAGFEGSLKSIQGSTQKFDRILVGPQSKGALGEWIVAEQLSKLPKDWVRTNVPFRNDTRVEFCVRTPNGLLIPIDSKWTGTRFLDELGQTEDKVERARLETAIKSEVWKRAQDLRKYLDDDRTIGFGIAAVPDPVFDLSWEVQPYLVKINIVLISYSLLVPYILLLVKLFLSTSQGIQAMQISQILNSTIIEIEQIQEFIDTKLRRPLDTFKQQQSEYRSQSEGINDVYQKLKVIQIELDVMRSSPVGNTSLSNFEISAIPDELKHRVGELRKNLIESKAKQDGHVQSNSNQKPEEL